MLRAVIESLGEPVLSTSVNEAGEPPLEDLDAIERRFAAAVDILVDAGALSGGLPSTVVDFTGEAPAVIRAGAYAWDGAGNPSK
jgi:tRNA A37 threonylcarbamoyladenosine synthetase subunit TsaC/SUA5/YrdC